jgi:hypothetical protein
MPIDRDTTFNVIVNEERHSFSTRSELSIDKHDLDEDMAKQAAHYAWFAVLHENARSERVRLEAQYDELFSRVDQEVRDKLDEESGRIIEADPKAKPKKPTETAIKLRVRSDKRLLDLERKLHTADHAEKLVGVIVDALYQRKDLIIAMARSRDREMSSGEVAKIKENLLGRRGH